MTEQNQAVKASVPPPDAILATLIVLSLSKVICVELICG
jgi:hypothetical protein